MVWFGLGLQFCQFCLIFVAICLADFFPNCSGLSGSVPFSKWWVWPGSTWCRVGFVHESAGTFLILVPHSFISRRRLESHLFKGSSLKSASLVHKQEMRRPSDPDCARGPFCGSPELTELAVRQPF